MIRRSKYLSFLAGVALIIVGRVNDNTALFIIGIVLIVLALIRAVLDRRRGV